MRNHFRLLFASAVTWTVLGLASGLFYREFSKHFGVLDRSSQLGLVHTHTLMLGTFMFLLVLALVRTIDVQGSKLLGAFVVVWNIGLLLTTGGLIAKGCLQILGNDFAASPMLAGISGLGHMTLTAGFVLLLLALRPLARPISATTTK